MSNDPQKAPNGVFLDTKTGNVVDEPPEEGIQLVPPGGEIDANAKQRIEAEGGVVPAVVGEGVPLEVASAAADVEVAADPSKTVDVATARPRRKKT